MFLILTQFSCIEGCSDCCINREYFPSIKYGKIGVLLLPEEKLGMEIQAKKMGIRLRILPRLGVGMNKLGNGPKRVIAYQMMGKNLDGSLCPFLDTKSSQRSPHGGYTCQIYEKRPLACCAYPIIAVNNVSTTLDGKCQFCKKIVLRVDRIPGELALLADRHEPGPEVVRDRRSEDEPAGLDPDHLVDVAPPEVHDDQVGDRGERDRIGEHRRDVFEDDPGLRKSARRGSGPRSARSPCLPPFALGGRALLRLDRGRAGPLDCRAVARFAAASAATALVPAAASAVPGAPAASRTARRASSWR